jgi:hypothetical protein
MLCKEILAAYSDTRMKPVKYFVSSAKVGGTYCYY